MVFWLGLFAGLIIGWVIEWVIDWRFWRRDQAIHLDQESQLRRELESARLEITRLQTQISNETPAAPPSPDRLQDIKGIGQAFAKRLNEAGIFTFVQVGALSPEQLERIIKPQEWQTLDYSSWISQARALTQKTGKGG
ncbi:MAG: hypothetical protein R3C14_34430 [Caldilineaceae bacterium]